jgi:quercetin dioxygenase-like cupin family protein
MATQKTKGEKTMEYFIKHNGPEVQHPEPGIERRIMAYCDKVMLCELKFVKGTTSALHKHPHEQITYVISGALKFSVDGQEQVVRAGDVVYMPANKVHGVLQALEDSVIVDTFAPKRDDFLR